MLVVTKTEDGWFECKREGDIGSYICGRGASPLEAIGSWCIYSRTVEARCDPPSLLNEFQVHSHVKPRLSPAPTREDKSEKPIKILATRRRR